MWGLSHWIDFLYDSWVERVCVKDFVDRGGMFARFEFGGTPDVG